MTRTGTWAVFAATRISILATAVSWTTVAAAQSLPSLSHGDNVWQSRPFNDRDNPFQGESGSAASDGSSAIASPDTSGAPYGGAVWQASESANAVPHPASNVQRPSSVPATSPAKPTRWLAPTSSGPRPDSIRSAVTTVNRAERQTANDYPDAQSAGAHEPQQFVPPINAARLSTTAPQGNNDSAVRNPQSDSAAVNSADRPTSQSARPKSGQRIVKSNAPNQSANQQPNKTNSNASAAQYNGSAARTSTSAAQRSQTDRDQLTAAPAPNQRNVANRPPSGSGSQVRLFDDGGWIHPLRQVAYMATGGATADPGEMDLPSPNAQAAPPQRISGGPMPGGPMQGDGQWIGGAPGGQCCDSSCGPSCPCGGCPCDGGPCCGDCCEPSCGEPSCGAPYGPGRVDDLICVGWGDDESCHTIRVRVPKFQEVMIDVGVHGFKGPFDQDRDHGNFGFNEGFNIGAKVPFLDWGYQFGYQATQSELSGDSNTNDSNAFTQSFVTAGLFHRTPDGLQGGIAWDWMHDERNQSVDLAQFRAELSLVTCGCHECGVTTAFHLNDRRFQTGTTGSEAPTPIFTTFQATNQYLLFYRLHGCRGGEGRVFGGVSDGSDGIVGADFLLPLVSCWSLQSEFTYLIPDNGGGIVGSQQEAWNLGINLVWHWKNHARECHSNPYRPLFNVADNGSFIVDDR